MWRVFMSLTAITQGLPDDLSMQLLPNEVIYYFSYIAFQGGCGSSSSRQNYWIALSNKRVIYKTKVMEGSKNYVEKDGILPLDKISFIEVTEGQASEGCASSKIFQLRISSSGGTVIIPIPTKEKGYEIRKLYSQITEMTQE
ncbi:hypothetical protein EBB07_16205 [Paenibacillaceae bacterium]|nr:hypothetical protein EBB07_16205 [Paenibacillaceae bacterium]